MTKKPVRAPPRRTMRKEEAVRHLIHAAVRMFAEGEDPFAICLLIHSADKMLIDLSKKTKKPLVFRWDEFAKPEHIKTIFRSLRETYNFLKHAEKDHDEELGVYDITYFNAMTLGLCVVNFQSLFGYWTDHMRLFHAFLKIAMPKCFVPAAQRVDLEEAANVLGTMTPIEYFADLWTEQFRRAVPSLRSEKVEDLADTVRFFNTRLSDLEN